MKFILCISALTIFAGFCHGFKAVMIVPGFMYPHLYFEKLKQAIVQEHPGTDVIIATFAYGELTSLPMWTQIDGTYKNKDVQDFLAKHPDGFHMFSHSQGNLLGRALIEKYGFPVINFVAVAGDHSGFFGVPSLVNPGNLAAISSIMPIPAKAWHKLMYNDASQQSTFLAGIWNDPCQQESNLKNNIFLPIVNNLVNHTQSAQYKENFSKLTKLYLFGGPQDGVISPWQSSMFDFVDCDGKYVDMKDQQIYKEDLFGLKTLDLRGGIVREIVPDTSHNTFAMEPFLKSKVLPLLT